MIGWRIYYGNGLTWDSDVENAPGLNVVGVQMVDAKTGRRRLIGVDFYWYDDNEWYGPQDKLGFGLWDYLQRPGWKKVIFGRTLRDEAFSRVLKKMDSDPDFPLRSGWHSDELK